MLRINYFTSWQLNFIKIIELWAEAARFPGIEQFHSVRETNMLPDEEENVGLKNYSKYELRIWIEW